MHNINYPGEICLALSHFVKQNPPVAFRFWRVSLFVCNIFCAISAFGAVTVAGVQNKGVRLKRFLFSPVVFFVILLFGLISCRMPNLILPELEVDESQYIVAAASINNGGLLWKDVGGAHGPLITLPLCLLSSMGDGLNYAVVRIFGLLCIIGSILFIWKTLAELYHYTLAAITVLAMAFFFAIMNCRDLIAYNSEHVPMLITAICMYLFFTLQLNARKNWLKLFYLGILLGLFPFAKMQAIYIGLVIGLSTLARIVFAKNIDLKGKLFRVAILISGVTIPVILAAFYVIRNHAYDGFLSDNFTNLILYTKVGVMRDHYTGLEKLLIVFRIFKKCHEAAFYFMFSCGFLLLVLALRYRHVEPKKIIFGETFLYSSLFLIIGYFTVIFPGNSFPHYIILLLVPYTIWIAICIGELTNANKTVLLQKKICIPFLALLIFSLVISLRKEPNGIYYAETGRGYDLSDVSRIVLKYVHYNEKMAIWGWSPVYFVETGLTQGNYNAITNPIYFAEGNTKTNPYANQYVHELAQNKPVIFLDAVAPDNFYYYDTIKFRHEVFPVINKFISENYQLVGNLRSIRIYVLNKTLEEHKRTSF